MKILMLLSQGDMSYECMKYMMRTNIIMDIRAVIIIPYKRRTFKQSFVRTFKYVKEVERLLKNYNGTILKVRKFDECYDYINRSKPDLIISAGCKKIIPKNIFTIPKKGTINIHGSYLPKGRGRTPHVDAIRNGDKFIGVTVHHVSEIIDGGKIICQEKLIINPDDTSDSLYERITYLAPKVLYRGITNEVGKG